MTTWTHIATLPVMPRVTTSSQRSLCGALGDLDREARGSLTSTAEALLERAWDAVHAITELAPVAPTLPSAPVVAMLLREQPGGALTATVRIDDAEGSGYTIPELIVGSDGVHECGAPHFDRLADAIAWARAAGWRVLMERAPSRDVLPGDSAQPRPVAA